MTRRSRLEFGTFLDRVYYLTNEQVAAELDRRGYPGIRAAHGKVFENLGDGSSISALAERAQITKQSMADLVSHLERLGYLERVPHPVDRRAQLVRTTKRGKAAVAMAMTILSDLYDEWARVVGPRAFDTATRVLEQLVEHSGRKQP